jgi:hypothetical protein
VGGAMATKKKHFSECVPPNCVLVRKGDYRERCATASKGFNSTIERHSEVHHLVCEHSIAQRGESYPDAEQGAYIEACLSHVQWDINNIDNLLGLPRNRRFREAYKGPDAAWTPRALPSHQVDHNTLEGYTYQVSEWLRYNIWSRLEMKKKDHSVDIATIKQGLEEGSLYFREKLEGFGIRQGGTVKAWRSRFDAGWEDRWYEPFSMIESPSPRHPGRGPD